MTGESGTVLIGDSKRGMFMKVNQRVLHVQERLKSGVAVVIPAFNESLFIHDVLIGIPDWVQWILVVDDASTDLTREITLEVPDPRIHLIRHDRNCGVGAAIVSGYRMALKLGADVVAVMGGDGQMDPADLRRIVEPVTRGWADYVKGNRFLFGRGDAGNTNEGTPFEKRGDGVRSMPAGRRFGIKVFTLLTRWSAGCREFGDAQCGYTAAGRAMLEKLDLGALTGRYGFPNDMILQVIGNGYRMVEVSVRPVYGEETSGIRPWIDLPRMAWRILSQRKISSWRHHRDRRGSRMVILTTSFPRFDGDPAGSFVAALAAELARRIPVTVIAPDHPGAVWSPSGVRVRRFRWCGWNHRRSLAYGHGIMENIAAHALTAAQIPFFLWAMRRAAAAEYRSGDGLMSHWLVPCGWIASAMIPAARRSPGNGEAAHIAVVHGSDLAVLERLPRWVGRRIAARAAAGAGRIVAVSGDLKERLRRILPEDNQTAIEQLPMGIDLQEWLRIREFRIGNSMETYRTTSHQIGINTDRTDGIRCNVLFIGRLIPIKGVDVLIRAIMGDSSLMNTCTLHIAGDGPEREPLMKLAKVGSVTAVFHGFVSGSNRSKLFIDADVAVVPSIVTPTGQQDGTPMVVPEFLASGIPVIASRTGGIPDIIDHDHNGLLTEPGDPVDLAAKLRGLLADPKKSGMLVEYGFETARKLDVRILAEMMFPDRQTC